MIGTMPAVLSAHDVYPRAAATQPSPVALTAGDVEASPRPPSPFEREVMIRLAASWVDANLEPLRNLTWNWDSYGGVPLDRHVSDTAERLVTQLLVQGVLPPQFFPTPEGGLSIEWHESSVEFSIDLPRGARDVLGASVYFVDEAGGIEWEEPYANVVGRVGEILGRFVDRAER